MNNITTPVVTGDVDIDFANRTDAISLLEHIPASIIKNSTIERHNTGVYFHAVPIDPVSRLASLHYKQAEANGWFKVDLLNVGIYELIRDEQHLINLMQQPLDWQLLEYPEFTSQLIHLGNHAELTAKLKPCSIPDIATILALIRPGKRYLVDRCLADGFQSIQRELWEPLTDGSYSFRKSHSVSYAMLVKVHANLLVENISH